MRIAFTGTRSGMTYEQMEAFDEFVQDNDVTVLIHGDCIGADKDAHELADVRRLKIELHPCNLDSQRAYCDKLPGQTDTWRFKVFPVLDPLARNRHIVIAGDVLIACPSGPEVQRSGTWSTIRFAQRVQKTVYILWPDGLLTNT